MSEDINTASRTPRQSTAFRDDQSAAGRTLVAFLAAGFLAMPASGLARPSEKLRIVVAQTAADTGIMKDLANRFRELHPSVKIEIHSAGAFKTLDMGRKGNADLIITHVPENEKLFLADNHGLLRTLVMYNEFAIMGPRADPLKLSREQDLFKVLKAIAREQVSMLVPGKRSGTMGKLNELWLMAGIDPNWVGYEVSESSSSATLREAALFGHYTFSDLGTYLVNRETVSNSIVPLYRDNVLLRNYYSAIVINQKKHPQVNQELATLFLEYLVSTDGQEYIRNFGVERYGVNLFVPAASLDEGLRLRRDQIMLQLKDRHLKLMTGLALTFIFLSILTGILLMRIRQIERLRRYSEERFELAVSGSNDGIWDWDVRRNEAYISKRMKQILGILNAHDVITNPVQELQKYVHPDDQQDFANTLKRFLNNSIDQLFVAEFRILKDSGTYQWTLMRGKALHDEHGKILRISGSVTDITGLKERENLRHLAHHDILTGLPNRSLLDDRLHLMIHAMKRETKSAAVIMADLDNFKQVNDRYGHAVGDKLLQLTTQRLRNVMRKSDTIARYGGDEFVILLPLATRENAEHTSRKVMDCLGEAFVINGLKLKIGVSLGIALFPDHGIDETTLLKHADSAMYHAKRTRVGIAVYEDYLDLGTQEISL